jgi:hypothetical protein
MEFLTEHSHDGLSGVGEFSTNMVFNPKDSEDGFGGFNDCCHRLEQLRLTPDYIGLP